jgi:hypothetical protein
MAFAPSKRDVYSWCQSFPQAPAVVAPLEIERPDQWNFYKHSASTAQRFKLALHLPFNDADTFNSVQKEDILPDDMVFVKQPLEDLP